MVTKGLQQTMRRAFLAAVALWLAGTQVATAADLSATVNFNIAPQPLSAALLKYSEQSGIQVTSPAELLDGINSGGVIGAFSAKNALTRLLSGTELNYQVVDPRTVTIRSQAAPQKPTADRGQRAAIHLARSNGADGASSGTAGDEARNPGDGGAAQDADRDIGEIIVTAQKREERLRDVPVPVTSIGADTLIGSNQLRIQDYYSRIPGFSASATPSLGNQLVLSIRGITTGAGTNPTVGVSIDDVPFGSTTNSGGGNTVPDLDPSELARVEVLRGPQGTLYGASSMGGLFKFVTVDPSTEKVSGRVQAGISNTRNGDSPGYSARGAVNLPLSETVAVRASGFTRRDAGYIDNVFTGEDGINETDIYGGRVSALWRPAEQLSVKLSALYQRIKGEGSNNADVLPGLGDLQQSYIPNTGIYGREVEAYGATINARLGSVDLTAVSGYNVNDYHDSYDTTYVPFYASLAQATFGFNGAGTLAMVAGRTEKFTQEVRLSAPLGKKFEWLLGGFYTREESDLTVSLAAENPATGALIGSLGSSSPPTTFTEYAAFADLTFHVTDRFDVQVGGRESKIRQGYGPQVLTGVVFGDAVNPKVNTRSDVFTYLLTPRLKLSSDLMVYARLASGYRPSLPNSAFAVTTLGVTPAPKPDRTQNYEVGIKGELSPLLSFDASLYRIDWKDIQFLLIYPGTNFAYSDNGSAARSQGVELSVESRPVRGMTLSAWTVWTDAVLSEDFRSTTSVRGFTGDRLPLTSRFSAHFALDQQFALTDKMAGLVGVSVSYVGQRLGAFQGPPQASPLAALPRQELPAYTRIDLNAGVNYGGWEVDLFVNNLADKRGILGGGLGTFPPFAFTYLQPRTVGLMAARKF